jgi:geranyl-CoA carboxylase alpha subunit
MGIESVAVYSDTDANSLHVREATASYPLHGKTSAETYLDISKIIAAAKATGADSVHPGYGFLSENALFAQSVMDAGLTWIGPSPTAIQAVGSKAGAKQLAAKVGVPCLPGYFGEDQSDAALLEAAKNLGYPIMVKASEGGGGRGMRLVIGAQAAAQEADLLQAIAAARSEALSAFGSSTLVLERALLNPRHVEVQIFADSHGNCIHMGERDCSVQRRHQKIIEESPSPAISDKTRQAMCDAAVKLALATGYEGAGTVEFLVEKNESSEHFYLMEMNTRLQVEHCVTEMRTGLDLVEWQIRVARSEALPLTQDQIQLTGHAIEVRLCAEDDAFMPQVGKILHFKEPKNHPSIRFDHAIESGSVVSPYFDAMLGKVIAHEASRDTAIDNLIHALAQTEVLGLASNRAFLMECLDHAVFRFGTATVPFLSQEGDLIRQTLAAKRAAIPLDVSMQVVMNNGTNESIDVSAASSLPCPFARPVRIGLNDQIQNGTWDSRQNSLEKQAFLVAVCTSPNQFHAQHNGIDWFLDDLSFAPSVQKESAAGAIEIRAPFNGKVLAVHAINGNAVQAGETLFVIESMKLEHAVQATRSGTLADVLVATGQQVTPKQILARLAAEMSIESKS